MGRFSQKTWLLTFAFAVIAIAVIAGLTQLLDGGPEIRTSYDGVAAAVHPSIGRAAGLSFTFWSGLGLTIAALIFGFSLATAVTDEQIGRNEKSSNLISLIGCIFGLLLILVVYLIPAYDTQTFTHRTVPAEQAESVKNSDFRKKGEPDPGHELYLKHFRNQ